MRAARLLAPLIAALMSAPLLAACASSPADGGSGTTGTALGTTGPAGTAGATATATAGTGTAGPPGSSGTSRATPAGHRSAAPGRVATCAAAPATVVDAALGDTLTGPDETRTGDRLVVCDYKGPKAGLVKLRIRTDADAASFAAEKRGFTIQQMATKDEAFADEAFSNVLGGSYSVTTLVARKGSVEILVAGKATVPQEKSLLAALFRRV